MNLDNDDKIFLLTAIYVISKRSWSHPGIKSCYDEAVKLNKSLKEIFE